MERPKRPRFSFPYFSGSSSSSHCDKDAGRFIRKMVLSLKGEAARSEDMFAHIEEILISVRLAFLNCFLEFAAHLEQIGADLSQGTSKPDHQEPFINAPESVLDAHRKLLMVLSNIGYCKDELASEHYNKYKYIWLQSRGNDEDSSDLQDLIMSVSGLGGKMLECLVHTFLSLLEENRYDDLSLIANGFSQLMLELEYLETRLDPYLTHDATESLKSLQAAVLKKAPFSIFSSVDTFTKFEEDKESIDMRYDHPEGFVKLQTSPLNLLLQCNGR